jgi:hypothetical protein
MSLLVAFAAAVGAAAAAAAAAAAGAVLSMQGRARLAPRLSVSKSS